MWKRERERGGREEGEGEGKGEGEGEGEGTEGEGEREKKRGEEKICILLCQDVSAQLVEMAGLQPIGAGVGPRIDTNKKTDTITERQKKISTTMRNTTEILHTISPLCARGKPSGGKWIHLSGEI